MNWGEFAAGALTALGTIGAALGVRKLLKGKPPRPRSEWDALDKKIDAELEQKRDAERKIR